MCFVTKACFVSERENISAATHTKPWVEASVLRNKGDIPASHVLGLKTPVLLQVWGLVDAEGSICCTSIAKTMLEASWGRVLLCAVFLGAPVGACWHWGQRGLGWHCKGLGNGWGWAWLGCADSSVNKLGSGGEVVRCIFLIIELCTHYETITEPKYIKFQITNTSLYKRVIK